MSTVHKLIHAEIIKALDELLPESVSYDKVTVSAAPKTTGYELSTNAAMVLGTVLATKTDMKLFEFAQLLASKLSENSELFDKVEAIKPGFVNMNPKPIQWINELREINNKAENYGKASIGSGKVVNVEYVSANPTGPLHMGHCRGAVVGDALANLLEFAGYDVCREYYVNDSGNQVQDLAKSVYYHYEKALGLSPKKPEGFYPGDYLRPVAEKIARAFGNKFLGFLAEQWQVNFKYFAVDAMLELIETDLNKLGIHHDSFVSESCLKELGAAPQDIENMLFDKGLIYYSDLEAPIYGDKDVQATGAILPLFKSTEFGDDKDRPLKKADGSWTYFGNDIAYHYFKAQNADILVNIWGADHVGTVSRIKGALSALSDVPLTVKLVQMVHLMKDGEPCKMSKRSGDYVTIEEVVDEFGKDVVRFAMLTVKPDTQMTFDAVKMAAKSNDSPLFYVQYAYARTCSLSERANSLGISASDSNLELLGKDEFSLVQKCSEFPIMVERAANVMEPHRITNYVIELATEFHAYWNNSDKIIDENNPELSSAKLFVMKQVGQVIKNAMSILGVDVVEKMEQIPAS